MLCGSFQPAKPVRDTGKSSLTPSWIINWSCSIFFSLPPPSLKGPHSLCLSSLWSQRNGRMVALHRGMGPLFILPAEETPRNISISVWPTIGSQELAGFTSMCQNHWGAFKTKSIFWVFCRVCVCFKLLSPGQPSYLCHITSCPITALQKGPVSAGLTTWRSDGRMEGATSHPHRHCFGCLWLAERASERGTWEAGEAQHVCVQQWIEPGEREASSKGGNMKAEAEPREFETAS